ncbi:MAG: PDZ domain-containing protein, partial [Acidobacteria bacterium]|nr:PDZ domain-containing protein [Acidobacteriota bacterium]MBI3483832.1 PDZ domain-containing protein [Acidobacteriota bacterium]
MNRVTRAIVLTLSILVVSYVSMGYVLGRTNEDKTYRALGVFTQVLQYVQQDYVEEPNLQQVTSGALHGLLESLDPRSSYMSPREYAEYKQKLERGAKGEIGAALSKRFGYITVVAVLPDSPADKAGLRSGDILEAIAKFTSREMSIGQAQNLLSGDVGTGVTVSVVRRARAEPQDVDIVRAELPAAKMQANVLSDADAPVAAGIAYVRITSLTAGRADELKAKLLQLEKQGAKKLILDLRDCAFGANTEGIAAARLFVGSGTLGSLRGQTVPTQTFVAEPGKAVWKQPVTVLISNGTSGAAEILAAAIAGNQRGETLGERTFGSASEQKMLALEDGAAINLTVANYYRPDGKSIPEEGVVPGVEVRRAAVDVPDTDDDETPAVQQPEPPQPKDDAVLKKAIEMLLAPALPAKTDKKTAALKVRVYPEAS